MLPIMKMPKKQNTTGLPDAAEAFNRICRYNSDREITSSKRTPESGTKYLLGKIIKLGEDSTWSNMLSNVQGYCQVGE
jgi:hypothetical protein